jgi:hypothetical protein
MISRARARARARAEAVQLGRADQTTAVEHLAPSDQMITHTRRRLLMAARALRDEGVLPPGVEDAEVYRGARSGYLFSDDTTPWQDLYARQLAASLRPALAPLTHL